MKLIRIYFEKKDEAAYISHLDLQRVMARSLRRSGLPVWYSQGFNPHIYMSFALPLSLMQESLVEMVDCKTESEEADFSRYIEPLNRALPKGITVNSICEPERPASEIALADYQITLHGASALEKAVAAYNAMARVPVVRRTKRSETEIDLKETLPELKMEAGGLLIRLPAGGNINFNAELLLRALRERCGLDTAGARVLRTGVFTAQGTPFR